jgi:hypothetical protein
MTKILKTTLATAFATAFIAGAGVSFAGDNGGNNSGDTMSPTQRMNSDETMKTDPDTTGSIKCDNSNANINSGCDKPGHLKQEERMESE